MPDDHALHSNAPGSPAGPGLLTDFVSMEPPPGTQSVKRALAIVRYLASIPEVGATISDVSAHLGLNRSTAHRIANSLVEEGFLDFDRRSGLYANGSLPAELALSTIKDFHNSLIWETVVPEIAKATSQTGYLMTRTNDECVCIQRVYGDAVVRIAPFKPGNRLPLGVGPCGLALLAQFSDDEIEAYVRHFFATSVFVKRVTFLDPDRMISDAIACREKGYALTIGQAYPELFGLGIALPGEEAGSLAVCITAPVELMAERDPDDLYASMRQCIARWSAPES